ncbi:hypothetical protein ACH4VT_33590 [Streptomyces lydicus]|uniref:hypothetical protein n=1 Tax=Streptomyces lydicus TaxID=47763 RepID=UPI00379ED94C
MMQQTCGRCQRFEAAAPARPAPARPAQLVTDPSDQQLSTTCSRRLRDAGEFLDAVEFMLRRHPKATGTTLVVARDIASRMGASQDGHVAYAWREMMRRLRLGRSTIAEHVRILRELGLLVWVSHGSRRNVLRERLGARYRIGDGYRGTATIYAPCAPPAWDEAMGRIRGGHGYRSRVRGHTEAGRRQAIAQARGRRGEAPSRTPSFTQLPPVVPVPVVGEIKTPRPRSARPAGGTPPPRRQDRAGTTGVTPGEVEAHIAYTRVLRLEVWWLQYACLRRLAYAVRPLIQAGYSWQESARELAGWRVPQRPRDVVAYIRAGMRQRAQHGALVLPDHVLRPRRQAPADGDGQRHAAMPVEWRERYGRAFARYQQHLGGPLRAALKKLTAGQPAEGPRWAYRLREPESRFLASLPPQGSASRRPTPGSTAAAAAAEREARMQAALDDHAQAAAAFQRLRDQLAAQAPSAAPRATAG